jgi:hypothetical protein
MERPKTSASIFAVVFITIIIAEIFSSLNKAGLFLHFVAIFISVFYVILLKKDIFIISLSLSSLLRIINYSMPVFFPYTIYWFPLVYSPIFISAYLVIRFLRFSDEIGLNLRRWYIYLPLGMLIGYILAFPEFAILQPSSLISDFSLKSILTLCIVMYVFIALAEELVFRSVIQSSLEMEFGLLKGLLLAAGLFAAMHIQYGIFAGYAFFAGLLMGYIFQRTRSLLFITIIHGTINVMVFGLFHQA